jgi:ferritin-like protein
MGRRHPERMGATMASEGLHEPRELVNEAVVDRHRAIVSLMEELEAVDWYDQRAAATSDESLRAILAHNRDEEKEHAIMTLEWLRRHDPVLDENMRTYLFTSLPVTEVEDAAMSGNPAAEPNPDGDGSLGIGSLKGKEG